MRSPSSENWKPKKPNRTWCPNCKMTGHTLEKCFKAQKNLKYEPPNQIKFQLCNKQGHTATQCFGNQECQICKNRDIPQKIVS